MDKTTIKIWKRTRTKLKILSAKSEKPMTQLIDELVEKATENKEAKENNEEIWGSTS